MSLATDQAAASVIVVPDTRRAMGLDRYYHRPSERGSTSQWEASHDDQLFAARAVASRTAAAPTVTHNAGTPNVATVGWTAATDASGAANVRYHVCASMIRSDCEGTDWVELAFSSGKDDDRKLVLLANSRRDLEPVHIG